MSQAPGDAGELREKIKYLAGSFYRSQIDGKEYDVQLNMLIADEQTKLLEELEGELPNFLDDDSGESYTISAHNNVVSQVRTLLAKKKKELK